MKTLSIMAAAALLMPAVAIAQSAPMAPSASNMPTPDASAMPAPMTPADTATTAAPDQMAPGQTTLSPTTTTGDPAANGVTPGNDGMKKHKKAKRDRQPMAN